MKDNIYICIDGNSVGKVIEKYILLSDLIQLKEFSNALSNTIILLTDYIEKKKGKVFLSGGDNILALVPVGVLDSIIQEVVCICIHDVKFSIGLGYSSLDAFLALKYAKVQEDESPILYHNKVFKKYDLNRNDKCVGQ